MDTQSQNKLEISKSLAGSQASLMKQTPPLDSTDSVKIPSVTSSFKEYITQMNLAYSTEAMVSSQQSFGSRQQILDSDSESDGAPESRSYNPSSENSLQVSRDLSQDILIDIPDNSASQDPASDMSYIVTEAKSYHNKSRRVSFQQEPTIAILPDDLPDSKSCYDTSIPIIDVEISDQSEPSPVLRKQSLPPMQDVNEHLGVMTKSGLAVSMPNGMYVNSHESEENEARDQVSELKLTSSVFTSTLLSEGSDEKENSENAELSQSLGSSGGSFGKHLRNLSHVYGKKLVGVSAPVTPMISTHTLNTKTNEEGPYPLSATTEVPNQNEPELPKKMQKMVALSAHEMHPPPLRKDKEFCLEDYTVLRKVGKGGFAKVFLVREKKSSQKYYAIKCIKKEDIIRLKQEKQILNEKNILKKFKHPFIVDLFHTFQSRTHLFMTLEFVPGGDLYTLMKSMKQGFPEDHCRFYISEVVIALDYLHNINVVYRDLKPENILLDATGHIKLADFGFARILQGKTKSFCGTPDYIAYEIVANKEYNHTVDWWSLGVLIFELMTGKTPFRAKSSDLIYDNIQDMNIQWLPNIKGACLDLIQRLLVSNPGFRLGNRLGAPEIKMHQWFNSVNWKRLSMRQVIPPVIPNLKNPESIELEMSLTGDTVPEFQEILETSHSGSDPNASSAMVIDPFQDF